MKVLKAREGFLSDHEVYEQISTGALNSRKRKSTKDQPGNLQTIQLEIKNYFDRQAPLVKYQTDDGIRKFLTLINDYKLTKVEKLMVLNSRPTSMALLNVLVEEHEDRFSEAEMQALIDYVKECFPVPLNENNES